VAPVSVPPGIVELYISAHDGKLFAEFMAGIAPEPMHARILNRLDRARNGLLGDWRAVGEGACELRFDVGPDIACSSDWTAKKVILVCSGTKKTQAQDIAAARIYRRDYDTSTNGKLRLVAARTANRSGDRGQLRKCRCGRFERDAVGCHAKYGRSSQNVEGGKSCEVESREPVQDAFARRQSYARVVQKYS